LVPESGLVLENGHVVGNADSHNRLGTHRAFSAEILGSSRVTANQEVAPKRRHFRVADHPFGTPKPSLGWRAEHIAALARADL
jgi:hypothetical protein